MKSLTLLLFQCFTLCSAVLYLELPECPGLAPENGWPTEGITYHRERYVTLDDLCIHHPVVLEQAPDLGCICSPDGVVNCVLSNRAPLLAEYCSAHCQCSEEPRKSFRNRLTQSLRKRPVDRPELIRKKTDKVMPARFDGQVKKASWCGFGCTSFATCAQYEAIDGCMGLACQANEASAGQYFGIGTCSLLGRKRDTSMACHCNSTYVSNACCTSTDGLVWL